MNAGSVKQMKAGERWERIAPAFDQNGSRLAESGREIW